MKVRLNLATKALETHRRLLATAGAIGAIAGVIFIILTWHVYSVRNAEAALRTKAEQTRQEMNSLEAERADLEHFFNLPENARLHERSGFINTLIDERSLNWTQMFMDLEKILPAGVRVMSIEPKFDKGRVEVRLIAGATSDEAKLKFLHSLEDSQSFNHVALVSEHSPTQQAGATDHIVIELTAVYSRT
jgi:type IV pilus assembly protein PilN